MLILRRNITTVFLDLDGTLIDPFEGITTSVRYALHASHIEVSSLEELKKFIGPPLYDSFREYYGFDHQQANEAVKKYREYYSQTGILNCSLYPQVAQVLKILKAKNIDIFLATSKPTAYAKKILERYGLLSYFTFLSGAELDGSRTQKDEVIAHALSHCKEIDCSKIAMVGDRKYDMEGAKKFGMLAVGCLYGFGSLEELKEAGSDSIIEKFEELLTVIQ